MKSNCDKTLQQLLVAWHDPCQDGALAVGVSTLRSLTEKLNPATLIKLLPFWESRRPITTTAGTSSEVVRTGAGLERTVTYLEIGSPLRIALAFYFFLVPWKTCTSRLCELLRPVVSQRLLVLITGLVRDLQQHSWHSR